MTSYQSEIRAAQSRLAEIEVDLSERIRAIQSECSDRIVSAAMAAVSEMQPLRIFLQSMGVSNPASAASQTTSDTEAKDPPSSRSKASGRVGLKASKASNPRSSGRAPASTGGTGKIALLTILGGAAEPMSPKDVDAAMVAMGQSPDTARKERYLRFKDGLIARDADQRLSLSGRGKELLQQGQGENQPAG
jgi:hypothetical protein